MAFIFLDRQTDKIGLNFLQCPHIAGRIGDRHGVEECGGGELGERVLRLRPGFDGDWLRRLETVNLRSDLREVGNRQLIAVAQNDGAENGVFQLPHIARPVIGNQKIECGRRNAEDGFAFFGGKPMDEMSDQFGNVFAAFAQRRDVDGEDV